ncbi:Alpha/Beta hydrolase protein [Gloeopeniophorella convolvens]|nr:Alpha/Beta hydrolase protein [Gloeopeniophorella convolvens]
MSTASSKAFSSPSMTSAGPLKTLTESVALPPSHGYPFYITAKVYTCSALPHASDSDAATLIFLHSTSFHKETWEPTLTRLFELVASGAAAHLKIREAWAIDCPNHGEASVLNHDVLQDPRYKQSMGCEKYAHAVHRFLAFPVSLRGRITNLLAQNLIVIGHSLGGVATSFLAGLRPRVPFAALVVIEPMLNPDASDALEPLRRVLLRGAYERRDSWPSREKALAHLAAAGWHPQVAALFVQHALRPHPDPLYGGVVLCCSRDEEAGMYNDRYGAISATPYLTRACAEAPVHIILGAINDYLPRQVQESIVNPASGRRFASITHLEGVGHLVPQTIPERLAEVILGVLDQPSTSSRCRL